MPLRPTEVADLLNEYLTDLGKRARAAGRLSSWQHAEFAAWSDGTGTIRIDGKRFGRCDKPITEAINEVEA